MSAKTHPFHILNPSPWPLLMSVALLVLTIGVVLWMHKHPAYIMAAGTAGVVICFLGWMKDIIHESKTEHTSEVHNGFRYGMGLFILSELMFFVAFFWAYFNGALVQMGDVAHVWPPKNIQTIDPFHLPYLNTLLLLLSGTTITWAHYSLIEGNLKDMIQKTGLTVLIGVTFLWVQIIEYIHAPFAFKGGMYPSTFYMATGFHGFHVLVGTIFLLVCWLRAKKGHFTAEDHFGFEAAAWYWHFVDVVWLFLFGSIYWWGSNV
jgi:cytochrome c oxidase subunit 3